ncbi:unnamed protein product [Meganyctiphanes norvegica]|uniref:Uncharacterized protein n=1 Tax=Meganyctiphanes norvegica TaxID=48144 RepID=A0AAV2Q9G8_MEGNR
MNALSNALEVIKQEINRVISPTQVATDKSNGFAIVNHDNRENIDDVQVIQNQPMNGVTHRLEGQKVPPLPRLGGIVIGKNKVHLERNVAIVHPHGCELLYKDRSMSIPSDSSVKGVVNDCELLCPTMSSSVPSSVPPSAENGLLNVCSSLSPSSSLAPKMSSSVHRPEGGVTKYPWHTKGITNR